MNHEIKQRGDCPFCRKESGIDRAIYSDELFFIMPNRTKYDYFEGKKVIEHLMIIPRRHVEAFQEFTEQERLALINLIADYDKLGFNVYARGVGVAGRSVVHQHTHLIKSKNKLPKFFMFIEKPYFLSQR